jgi:hypothetical protein
LVWIPWGNLLKDSFRENRNETVFAKLDSNCQPQHPFLNFAIVGGNEVDYLGQGLQNQPTTFDDGMERTMVFPVQPTDITEKTTESEKPLSRRQLQEQIMEATFSNISPQCNLRIYLYASDELYRVYITKSPGFYLMGVIFAFVIIAIAFLIYDALVERRQYRVMDMAENTGRILSSLFPTQFADKLLAEKKEKEKEAKKKTRQEKKKPKRNKEFKLEQAPNKQLKKFMDTNKKGDPGCSAIALQGIAEDSDDMDESPLFLAKSKPIADLFPDTTVLFSDIAGFTGSLQMIDLLQCFVFLAEERQLY